ncbi:MAG: glycosyltransferase family 9 protein [Fibrobacteres bacterium]|nr:glycosyltransferase family 9 protein [Fibrobacterota bacterium]
MKVLLIQLRQIGDIMMCTPSIDALKRSRPDTEIHFLCTERLKFAVEGNPAISKIITCDKRPSFADLFRIRKENYDVIIDFMNLPRTALFAFLSGAPLRSGTAKRGRTLFYSHVADPVPESTYSAKQKLGLLKPLGIEQTESMQLWLYPSESDIDTATELTSKLRLKDTPNLCAFSPVSRRDYKRWPLEKFARVCDQLHEQHNIIFLPMFGPGEEPAIDAITRASRHPEAFKYPYTTPPFKSLLKLMECCTFYFGNDNGIRHVAIAAGLPTATIFGTPRPENWTPPDTDRHKWIWGGEKISEISENEVLSMVSRMLIQQAVSVK